MCLTPSLSPILAFPLSSMFAVWGNRTQDSALFSARNLDWNKDTGINKNKLVTVTVPDDGGNPSVQFGFVGLWGALTGMSSKGLTVHEANLEEDEITFEGFPWVLRLRYIMEYASDISEAKYVHVCLEFGCRSNSM